MQDIPKIVVNPRPTNRLPFEEIILLKLHAVFKLLGKPIAPFTDRTSNILHDALQVRKFLDCSDCVVSDATTNIYQCCVLRDRGEGFIDSQEVARATGTGYACHGFAEACAHGLVIGVGILKEVLVC